MSHSRGPGQLSMLARGHGLLGGGVQVDCFADDRRAFTLTGQSFIKPSSGAPSSVKPYRSHQLALPTTYVTKRGQMVLFTAPEDMIFGSSCHIHKREVATQSAAKQLKTTKNLMDSALNYSSENDKPISDSTVQDSSSTTMAMGVKAGHFTNVYLNSLQKANLQQKPTNQNADDCAVEDIEAKGDSPRGKEPGPTENNNIPQGDSDLRLVSECDSGLGHSIPSGRISIQSHVSDASSIGSFVASTMTGHVIRVPDGREVNGMTSSEPRGATIATPTLGTKPAEGAESSTLSTDDNDPLSSLRRELGLQQNDVQITSSKSKQKSSSKSGKKRHHSDAKASEHKTRKTKNNDSTATMSSTKTSKSKRKRTRTKHKPADSQEDHTMEMSTAEGTLESGMGNHINGNGDLEVTAIQLAGSIGSGEAGEDSAALQRMSRAEERRREVERKRAEKRELERRKREEEKRRLKLQEEIENLSAATDSPEHQEGDVPPSVGLTADSRDILAAHGVVTVNQKSLRMNLEEMRLKQKRLLLSYQGEGLERKLTEDMDSAQDAIERAREATEEMEARKQKQQLEEEEREREKREAEQCKRTEAQTATAATVKPKASTPAATTNAKSNQKVQRKDCKCTEQRPSERTFHTFTGKYMFSYFKYVPPQKAKVDNNGKKQSGKRKKRPKGIRSK